MITETTQKFEINIHDQGYKIKAWGSTRVGLFIAVLKGILSATGSQFILEAENVERGFEIKSDGAESLLVDFVNKVLTNENTNNEAYDDVKFTLITDKVANGRMIGRPVRAKEESLKSALKQDLVIKKNDEGLWEAEIILEK
ncbi:MAG: archease [Patescibacteria group bacterium]